jgi:hypothetical protein
MDDIVKVNVGGQLFVTTRATMCAEAGSMLAAKFDPESSFHPPQEQDGGVFLDRSPKCFEHVLNYLRNGCQLVSDIPDDLLKNIRADADYFGLERLKVACDTQLHQAAQAKPVLKKTDNKEFSTLSVRCSRSGDTADLVSMMNFGWRVEEKLLIYNGDGKLARYDFVLSRPV